MVTKEIDLKTASLDDDPDYRAASSRLTELQLEMTDNERESQQCEQSLLALAATSQNTKLLAEAQALIAGKIPEPEKDPVALRGKLEKLRPRLRVLFEAIRLQRAERDRLRYQASEPIARALAPQHRELVRQVAGAAVALSRVIQEEAEFRATLTDKNILISSHITPMVFHGPGLLSDENSRVRAFLKECAERGFLTRGEADRLRAGSRLPD